MFKLVAIGIFILLLWMLLGGGVKKNPAATAPNAPNAKSAVQSNLKTPTTAYARPGIVLKELTTAGFHVRFDPSVAFAGQSSGISNHVNNTTVFSANEGVLTCITTYTYSEGKSLYAQLKEDPANGVFKRRVANVVCLYSRADGSGKLLPDKHQELDQGLEAVAKRIN